MPPKSTKNNTYLNQKVWVAKPDNKAMQNVWISRIRKLIILLLVNFLLEKSFSYCIKCVHLMHIHISKKGINISLDINLNVLRKFMILCWATLIEVLGRMRPAGQRLDSPGVNYSWSSL